MENKTGVLLVNLGTPDSPAPRDVYRYLIEFLSDKRVIDMPWLSRQLLVRGVIVPKRYRQSAKAYQKIWMPEGSPLKVYGHRVKEKLQTHLGEGYVVDFAMRYRSPSIEETLNSLIQKQVNKIIVIPLFPQYASATTGSVHEKIMDIVSQWINIPELVLVNNYSTHPALIRAFCAVSKSYDLNNYDHILLSFHGLPEEQLIKADCAKGCLKTKDCCARLSSNNQHCYAAQCHATARTLAEALNLGIDQYSVSFQSRLGRKPWLKPYTNEVIRSLARQGKKKILVFCPAFVCDCLETIYEIGIEYAEEFKHAGGERLDLVPGLNDHTQWINALATMVHHPLNSQHFDSPKHFRSCAVTNGLAISQYEPICDGAPPGLCGVKTERI
ncbi:MAG: ferrochelatase [Parachlamydiaceae bacterium]